MTQNSEKIFIPEDRHQQIVAVFELQKDFSEEDLLREAKRYLIDKLFSGGFVHREDVRFVSGTAVDRRIYFSLIVLDTRKGEK